jgi:uncharacterized protein YoxC
MKVPTQNSAQDKRHNFVGWANVFFAHAERPCALMLFCSFALLLTGGCGPQEPPSIKKSRTIAAENIELRKELDSLNKEIKTLKEQHNREIDKQKKLLAECLQEKKDWQNKSRQNIRNQVKDVLDTVLEENKKLRESTGRLTAENATLKAQIEQLQKQP